MQPSQPYYQPPMPSAPQNPSQYDFIVNNSGGSRRPAPKNLLLFGIAAGVIVIVLVWIILSLAFGSSVGNAGSLTAIAQQQTEMVRVAKLANDSNHLSSQDARNFSRSVQLTVGSDKAQLTTFLAKHGSKLGDKQLALKHSSATDAALDAASASGTYDTTLVSTLQTQLKSYQTSLNQAYASTTSTTERALLKSDYTNAQLLLQQSNQHN